MYEISPGLRVRFLYEISPGPESRFCMRSVQGQDPGSVWDRSSTRAPDYASDRSRARGPGSVWDQSRFCMFGPGFNIFLGCHDSGFWCLNHFYGGYLYFITWWSNHMKWCFRACKFVIWLQNMLPPPIPSSPPEQTRSVRVQYLVWSRSDTWFGPGPVLSLVWSRADSWFGPGPNQVSVLGQSEYRTRTKKRIGPIAERWTPGEDPPWTWTLAWTEHGHGPDMDQTWDVNLFLTFFIRGNYF